MLGVLGLDDLDGNGPPGLGTAQIHQAHAARAQACDQAVRSYVRRVLGDQLVHGGTVLHGRALRCPNPVKTV
ncbi:hypothetical protein GCM10010388_22760 [Streptomyces mauvecolor]